MVVKTSSRHVLKTSSARLQRNNFTSSKTSCKDVLKTSWRRLEDLLQDVLEDQKLLRWKRLEDSWRHVLKTSWRHVLKRSWRHILKTSWGHVLKTSLRHVLKMSAKRLGDKQHVFWSYLYLTNLNVYLRNLVFRKAISDEFKLNPKLEPSNFDVCLILKLKQHLYFKN